LGLFIRDAARPTRYTEAPIGEELIMSLKITRRDALTLAGAGALAATLPLPTRAQAGPKRIPICVQLYSVRDECAKDFDAALAKIAEMGFEGVEFAGYHTYGNNPDGLRKKLDALKLKAAATHIGANSFVGDALKRTIEFHKTIGCKFLIVPGDARFTHPDKSKEFAELMNKTAEALKSEALFCGYHNHTAELAKAEGDKTYWDLFAERTGKEVVLQQDAGHTAYARVDPTALVRKYPGRTKTTHIKGRLPAGTQGKQPFVGQDTIDWKAYATACYEVGGTEWFSIEQEDYPDGKSPMECTKISLDGFRAVLKSIGK
jgi:sugar phosphate isomerase/epimerase